MHYFACAAELPGETLDGIEADMQAKLAVRLAGFDALVGLVRGGGDPTAAVRAHLGLR
jgi:hypothetical protein